MMIAWPNAETPSTWRLAARTVSSRSATASLRPSACWRSAIMRSVFSTTITAPSTMSPKSIAPRLIRLPLMWLRTMPIAASSIESGIARAQIRAARKFPSSRKRITITSAAPSARFVSTVRIVARTSFVRSRTVFARIPGGSVRWISTILRSTADATVRLFSPTRMSAVPTTTSSPFSLAEPVRSSLPMPTVARSRTRIGVPPRVPTTISSISPIDSIRPAARTAYDSPACST
jgi:hypothetical protein